MSARMRGVLAMTAEFVFFPCREKGRALIWNNGQERGSDVGRITVGLQYDGRLLVDPQDFREGEQAKQTREGEDENLSSPQRLKSGEIQ